jgi:capsule polysaccharide export protein KpsE/RkpR
MNTSTDQVKDEAWVTNVSLLWAKRRLLARVVIVAFLLSLTTALLTPNEYESTTRIMPPQATGGGGGIAALAALAGKTSVGGANGLAGIAGSLLSTRSNGTLFVSLLHSGTIGGHIVERFQLQHVYRKRYKEDTAKRLARNTVAAEDPKSGVISITVTDKDRQRARDMAQAYLDELNVLVASVNTSSARREREFIEQRLQSVQKDLQQAQEDMSAFAQQNTAIDIKEQTRAVVDAGARLQGQLIAGQSELDSLEQVYGNENVRVRAAQARVGVLRRELGRASGSSTTDASHPYPALGKLPGLAVPWANLYRRVRIQETVFELLSAQYESSRIEEARSIPTVSVIDPPNWPERKALPHRATFVAGFTLASFVIASFLLFAQRSWQGMEDTDTRKVLGREVLSSVKSRVPRLMGRRAQ